MVQEDVMMENGKRRKRAHDTPAARQPRPPRERGVIWRISLASLFEEPEFVA
jgi:hypothetical protein